LSRTLSERPTVFEAYERSMKGPKVDEKTWDFEIIPQTAKRLKEKYGIVMDKHVVAPPTRICLGVCTRPA
jgi:methylamine--corrinoid protein Co-methyltransferase